MKKRAINIYTIIMVLLIVVMVVSLIPILRLAPYDYPTGDDLGYGTLTHHAWLKSHSLPAVFGAVWATIVDYYKYWQGTWFTIAVMSLQPEVFRLGAYPVTPWIMLTITILSTTLVVGYICKKIMGMPTNVWISIDLLILLATIQFFPSTASSIYWFNGCAHYIVPFGLAMLCIWSLFKYREVRLEALTTGQVAERGLRSYIGYIVLAGICMTLLGGASYLMPVFVIVFLFYLFVYDFVVGKQRWLMLPMLIPAGLELAGLLISFLSPGNKARGGEEFGFSIGAVFFTIFESFRQAFIGIFKYAKEYPAVYVSLIFIGLISFSFFAASNTSKEAVTADSEKREVFSIRELKAGFVLTFVLAMFCIYAAVHAPGIYAGVEVSGGVPNTIFQVYILTAAASVIVISAYLSGWLKKRMASIDAASAADNTRIKSRKYVAMYTLIILFCFAWIFVCRSTIKLATSYEAYKYMASGQADDFKNQMDHNRELLLDAGIEDCRLVQVSDVQGPLMHMPVTSDPENFTNRVTRDFYSKNSVVCVD